MKRGEIWTVSGGPDYAGKPRPIVIVQSDRFDTRDSITICPFTTDPTDAPLLRLEVAPSASNGLRATSRIMIDKITTVPRGKLGAQIGRLSETDLRRLSRGIVTFLALME
ncbi:MAG TPA: type II toxin-antitoxin system PemK/MazF family toxin [Magnetospirillaceae bacterium]|jgi:mRNA interferase MazF